MRKILQFELYKIFQQKFLLFFGLFLLLFLTLDIVLNASQPTENNEEYRPLEGQISEVHDPSVTVGIAKKLDHITKIHQSITKRVDEINKRLSQLSEDTYAFQEYQLEKELLTKIAPPVLYDDAGATEIHENITDITILIAAFLTLGLASVFSIEDSTGVHQNILSSEKGRTQLVTAKILASLLFTVLVCALFNLYSLLLTNLVYGTFGWGSLIQYLPLLDRSPYPLTMGEFYVIKLGFQTLAAGSFALFILTVSALSKNSLISFCINGFVYIQFILSDFDAESGIPRDILTFTYFGLMRVTNLFKEFGAVNLFSYPLLFPTLAIMVLLVLYLIPIKIMYFYMQRKEIA